MTAPKSKTTSSTPIYSPPVEAQRQLMAKAHPVKNPGDLCLGVVKQNGGEYLAYSSVESGGVCHVGGLKAERVGYVSADEVQDFIAKYSPFKAASAANSVINLVANAKAAKAAIINREIQAESKVLLEKIYADSSTFTIFAESVSLREYSLDVSATFLFDRIYRTDPLAGLCEYFKAAKGLSKAEKKEIDWLCSQKKSTKAPLNPEFTKLLEQLNGMEKR